MVNSKEDIRSVVNRIKKLGGKKVKFIILFGSAAEGNQTPLSDIDLAVYYEGPKGERFRFRMKILGRVSDKFDIQTFQDLPLYIQQEVLSGKILYYDESRFLYEMIRRTSRDFDEFKYKFYDYIRGGVIA
ncbi:MAG: nucleotidyltransferase domain-containing protein [Thermoplasmatales archaeon]|nr:nucleotidyltransferase domain-containing protein [Thermoplasmatales archaeon]